MVSEVKVVVCLSYHKSAMIPRNFESKIGHSVEKDSSFVQETELRLFH